MKAKSPDSTLTLAPQFMVSSFLHFYKNPNERYFNVKILLLSKRTLFKKGKKRIMLGLFYAIVLL